MPLKKCSMCAIAAYCGAGCQKADWKAHKGQCAELKAGAVMGGEGMAVELRVGNQHAVSMPRVASTSTSQGDPFARTVYSPRSWTGLIMTYELPV